MRLPRLCTIVLALAMMLVSGCATTPAAAPTTITRSTPMSAYYLVTLTIRDPAQLGAYRSAVGPTLDPFGGTVLLNGRVAEVTVGTHRHQAVVVLSFPDTAAALAWYHSPAYQAIIPMRGAAMDADFVLLDGGSR